ncbi:MAG TPA: signal peptide peptidase SppA [Anaeromyxobacteraceae bacterium]|nr:signal peptide peptidase SppA [Anaeromyxobacteraceae bacterium]
MATMDPNEPLPTTPVEPGAPAGAPAAGMAPPAASQPQWGAPPSPPPAWTPPAPRLPPPAPPRRDRLAVAVVLFIFGGLFLVFFAFLVLAYTAVKGETPRLASGPRIGVVPIEGVIGVGGRGGVDSQQVLRTLKRYADDGDMKAIVVRIDSPGGAVAPSQEIFDELRRVAEDKVVICSMGNVAASGGLYVAMGCDRIVAAAGTLTGSIGVLSQFYNVKGLAERFSVKTETVKSGKLKDAGNPFRDMTPEDRAYWQGLVDQVYRQFVSAVAESRDLAEDEVRKFADGRVLTGEQAQQLGLIDDLGNFHDAVDLAQEQAGLKGTPRLVYPPEERVRFFEELWGDAARAVARVIRSELRDEALGAQGPGLWYLAR